MAHFVAGRDDEAFAWADKASQRNPFLLAAALIAAASGANLGRADDVARYVTRVHQLNATLTISTMPARMNLRRPQDRAHMLDGLRKAGLPE